MPSLIKQTDIGDTGTPSKGKLAPSSKSPLSMEDAKSSVKATESIEMPSLAKNEATHKSELRVTKRAEKLSDSSAVQAGEESDHITTGSPIKSSKVEDDVGSSAENVRKSVVTTAKRSELSSSEKEETEGSSSCVQPLHSETALKTDEPTTEVVSSKSPKVAKDENHEASTESTEKYTKSENEPQKVPDMPSINISSSEVKEVSAKEPDVLDSTDKKNSEESAARGLSPPQRDLPEEQQCPSPHRSEMRGFECFAARLCQKPELINLSFTSSRKLSELSGAVFKTSVVSGGDSVNVVPPSAEAFVPTVAERRTSGMTEAGATGGSLKVESDQVQGPDYVWRLSDSLRERDSSTKIGGQVCIPVEIRGPESSAFLTAPRLQATNRQFNILLDISRYNRDSISIDVLDDKIDVYAKQQNENDFGEELHEVHQIFTIPEIADASRITACITSEKQLFIQAPLKIRGGLEC